MQRMCQMGLLRQIVTICLVFFRVSHMESTASALLAFFIHVLNNVGELSFYSLTLIRFQEGKRGIKYCASSFLLIGLAIHVAF